VDQKLIRVWADESGETLDWLAGLLSEYGITHVAKYDIGTGYHGSFRCWPTHPKFMKTSGGAGELWFSVSNYVAKKAKELGAEFRFRTPLVKLIREGDGRVSGAIAGTSDGKYIKINTSRAIIICTGGYADDPELFTKLNPCAASVTTLRWVQPGTTGDGIKAGIWVGGVKDLHPSAMLFDRGITKPGGRAGYPFKVGGFLDVLWMGSQPFLKVNMDGRRYFCESAPYDFSLYPLEHEKNGVFCMIWDSNYWKHMESFHTTGCSRMVPSTSVPATGEGMGREFVEKMISRYLGEGLVQQADTFEELAWRLKLPPEVFKATVERYNELATMGVDEDFGKPAKDLYALDSPPFYGATVGGWLLTTMDGLRVNEDAQVLDADFGVIEGLYAAGDAAGGFFAHNYPELAVGVDCGKGMTFGRHAVLHGLGRL
jgi:succinate dehydrogenase/fumarate reductase flavoprotein subunit